MKIPKSSNQFYASRAPQLLFTCIHNIFKTAAVIGLVCDRAAFAVSASHRIIRISRVRANYANRYGGRALLARRAIDNTTTKPRRRIICDRPYNQPCPKRACVHGSQAFWQYFMRLICMHLWCCVCMCACVCLAILGESQRARQYFRITIR